MKFGKTPAVSGALALQAVREVGSCVSLSNCEPVPFLLEIKKNKNRKDICCTFLDANVHGTFGLSDSGTVFRSKRSRMFVNGIWG